LKFTQPRPHWEALAALFQPLRRRRVRLPQGRFRDDGRAQDGRPL